MTILGLWVFFIAIGMAAAHYRNFSLVWGFVGGLLLGPLSFLMFFVSGVTRRERVCPYCAERIRSEAKVCRHCGRDVNIHTDAAQRS